MQSEDYRYLFKLEAELWWFVGMREVSAALLDPVLGPERERAILDAGCGTGGNLAWLRRYAGGGEVVGLDLVGDALAYCRGQGHGPLVQASATDLPFADARFDLVTSFDVLGQLPGAGAGERAAREMFRVLRPGGVAFVRAAAYEWMRSGHDAALGTHRRYSLGELRGELERAGFRAARATYANSLLLPLAALRRQVLKRLRLADAGSDVKPLPESLGWLNGIFKQALLREARWLRRPHSVLPAGLSAVCVAEKPREG